MAEPLPDIAAILEQLAQAQTPAELRELHGRLGFAIKTKRKRAKKELCPLAKTFEEAMRIWDADKAHGVPLADRQQHLAQTLRAVWPLTRVWRYVCDRCNDTGWEPRSCTPETHCGRRRCEPGHDYVVPCVCLKGEGRRQQLTPSALTQGDFEQAGKGKRKGFTKVGR